ncbi:MAG TPA: hypothetical protein VKR31_03330 [Rhizomicrobium sp.]|nr:hypothetical protein [Rhizomicrobium sp.]
MRRAVLILVTLVATAAAGFQAIADQDNCTLKGLASLEITTSTDGWALVPVQLGSTTLEFAVNPAQMFSMLTESVAREQQLKFVTIEGFYERTAFLGMTKFIAMSPIRLGHADVQGTNFAIIPRQIGNDPRVAGILGLDVLSAFDVLLDFAHSKVVLISRKHCSLQGVLQGPSVPMKITNWFRIPVQVNGRNVEAEISGISASTYVNPHSAMENFGVEVHAPAFADEAAAVQPLMPHGRITPAIKLGINTITVDGIAISNPITRVYDCEDAPSNYRITCDSLPPLELGISELQKVKAYLDFQDGLFFAMPADASPAAGASPE